MATTRDYYDILGVSKSATTAEIKSAYRKLALKWHPDRNKEADAHEKFKEINEAYEVLSNPEKKAKFDQFGHAAFNNGGGGNPFGAGGNPFEVVITKLEATLISKIYLVAPEVFPTPLIFLVVFLEGDSEVNNTVSKKFITN